MDISFDSLPTQMEHRAATAIFIAAMYEFSRKHGLSPDFSNPAVFADLPAPPEHMDTDLVDDCRSVASTLAQARAKHYRVSWSAEEYANDVGGAVLSKPELEDVLMEKYPPLIDAEEVLNSAEQHLPIVDKPAVFTDRDGRVLVWSLPDIIPERRHAQMLKATRCLEAQLSITKLSPDQSATKQWRTGPTFFTKGTDWKYGTVLLYPVGFALGHTGPKYPPGPSSDAKSQRAKDWMAEFEDSGGLLDGILAVTQPHLYVAAQDLAAKVFRKHGRSRALMELWPSSYSSIQVIVNRQTPLHRDTSGLRVWLDLLLTLGTYAETGVLELRNLGVCVPYNPGSVAMINSRLIIHGVPKVAGDRVCYACFMNKHVFERFEVAIPEMASIRSKRGARSIEPELGAGEGEEALSASGTDRDADGEEDGEEGGNA